MKRTKVKQLLEGDFLGKEVNVKGWVRTFRSNRFVALNDGSTIRNVQAVVDFENTDPEVLGKITTGACVSITGTVTESQGSGQDREIQAAEVEILGVSDPELYPLQPKKHSHEFLREIAHLRPRTNTFGAVLRVRHVLAFAIHTFFHEKGFFYLHAPIITGSDAEGAGEMFQVTTLDLSSPPVDEEGNVDFKADFFGKETNLTVSGQLEAEIAALALSEVYTFGPTFRAENSNTARHLAEFWMIEPEMAFYDLEDNMDLAEEFVQYIVQYVLDHCKEDIEFLHKRAEDEEKAKPQHQRSPMTLKERLEFVVANPFERVTYSEAFDILRSSNPNKKKKFEFPVEEWGMDFQSEHERYLVEKHFEKPVIVYDYPKVTKAFYMRENDDGKTVAAVDVLFPGIGEIIGGSQREERHDVLLRRIEEEGIDQKDVWWYLETRKFGTAPHSGFGLGFERMMQFVTGMANIRDVIPFPRTPGSAEF